MRFLFVLVGVLAALLLWTIPAKSQDCHTIAQTVSELDKFTKIHTVKAAAFEWSTPSVEDFTVLYVYFPSDGALVSFELYHKGCRVPNPETKEPRTSVELTEAIMKNIKESKLLFTNGEADAPVETF
jgi:hypothetical protein